MDEAAVRAAVQHYFDYSGAGDEDRASEIYAEDAVVEFPQSGERMDRDGLRRLQETFPGGKPNIRLGRLTGSGDVWVRESYIEYADGSVAYGVGRVEFRDGKIWKETRYYAEPFDPPAWRASWSKRIEEPVAG